MNAAEGEVKPCDAADADELSALALRSKAHWGYPQNFLEQCRDELTYSPEDIASTRYSFRAIRADQCIAAFYAIEWLNGRDCELDALFVDPAAIGRGLGRRLVNHAMRLAGSRGMRCLRVQGDPHAAGFYLACGGKDVGLRESASITGRMLPIYEFTL